MLFPKNELAQSPTRSACTDFDLSIAKQIKRSVVERIGIAQRYSSSKWANEIRILRNDIDAARPGTAEKRISEALDWFLHCDNRKLIGAVQCAASFRTHFTKWIEEEMRKKPRISEITPEAEELTKRLRNLHWPKGSEKDLLSAVQISLDRYKGFLQRLRQIRDNELKGVEMGMKGDDPRCKLLPVRMFLDHFLATHRIYTNFVENWFRDVFTSVVKWEQWSGNILAQAIDIQGDKFQKHGRGISSSYGESKRWTQLMELVNAH